jgi:hypothetical protein
MGRRICSELGLGDSCDTLSKWLANLLADKIQKSEVEVEPTKKSTLETQAVEIILRLWKQRYSLPACVRPFERMEKAITALYEMQHRKEHGVVPWYRRDHEATPWEVLADAIEDVHSRIAPLAIFTPIIAEMHGDPLDWERKNKDFLEPLEMDAVDLFDHWLSLTSKEQFVVFSNEKQKPITVMQKTELALQEIEFSIAELNEAFGKLKASIEGSVHDNQ